MEHTTFGERAPRAGSSSICEEIQKPAPTPTPSETHVPDPHDMTEADDELDPQEGFIAPSVQAEFPAAAAVVAARSTSSEGKTPPGIVKLRG